MNEIDPLTCECGFTEGCHEEDLENGEQPFDIECQYWFGLLLFISKIKTWFRIKFS